MLLDQTSWPYSTYFRQSARYWNAPNLSAGAALEAQIPPFHQIKGTYPYIHKRWCKLFLHIYFFFFLCIYKKYWNTGMKTLPASAGLAFQPSSSWKVSGMGGISGRSLTVLPRLGDAGRGTVQRLTLPLPCPAWFKLSNHPPAVKRGGYFFSCGGGGRAKSDNAIQRVKALPGDAVV